MLSRTRRSRSGPWPLTPVLVAASLALSACSEGLSEKAQGRDAGAREVVGDLGGVQVRIPRQFARNVEYDADPGILQPRQSPAPARTPSSRIRSFGFDFRYPDMAGPESSEEARKDRAASLPGNSQWIFVGLNAGEDYPGVGSNDRLASATLGQPAPGIGASYRPSAHRTCDLENHELSGNDARGRPYREHDDAQDIFIARDATGKVKTFIQCSNRNVRGAPCTQYFDLEPVMRARMFVQYRRGLLCEWQGIQSATSTLISSFRNHQKTK